MNSICRIFYLNSVLSRIIPLFIKLLEPRNAISFYNISLAMLPPFPLFYWRCNIEIRFEQIMNNWNVWSVLSSQWNKIACKFYCYAKFFELLTINFFIKNFNFNGNLYWLYKVISFYRREISLESFTIYQINTIALNFEYFII